MVGEKTATQATAQQLNQAYALLLVAVRDTKPRQFKYFPEMTVEAAAETYQRMDRDGFRLIFECDYTTEGRPVTSQGWVQDGLLGYEWKGPLPTIKEHISSDDKERRPILLDAPAPAGDRSYYRVLGAQEPGRKRMMYYTLGADELLSVIRYRSEQNWRPDALTPHWYEGQLVFILVLVKNDEEVGWRFRMDMSQQEYRAESAVQKRRGYLPLAFVSYKDKAEPRYASIWVPYRIP